MDRHRTNRGLHWQEDSGEGLIRDIILGIIGAFVGGWIFTTMGAAGVTGVNIYSIFVAVIGAVVVLVAYHAIFRAKDHGLIAAPPSHQSLQESQTLSGRRIQTWPNSRS